MHRFGFFIRRITINIIKIINNNIVSADDNNQEVVIMGRGIGFGAKTGDEVLKEQIEKTFRMETQEQTEKLKEMFLTHELIQIELSNEIIEYATKNLGKELNPNVYLTLLDHIGFAIHRFENKQPFYNVLLNEVKIFYPEEFQIGLYAIDLIKKETGIDFSEQEAAAIAVHIFNAEYDTSVSDAVNASKIANEIIGSISVFKNKPIDESSYSGQKLAVFLRTLSLAIIKNSFATKDDKSFYRIVSIGYKNEMIFAERIGDMIKKDHKVSLPKQEIATLAILINQL